MLEICASFIQNDANGREEICGRLNAILRLSAAPCCCSDASSRRQQPLAQFITTTTRGKCERLCNFGICEAPKHTQKRCSFSRNDYYRSPSKWICSLLTHTHTPFSIHGLRQQAKWELHTEHANRKTSRTALDFIKMHYYNSNSCTRRMLSLLDAWLWWAAMTVC